jgi:hypothetical protein
MARKPVGSAGRKGGSPALVTGLPAVLAMLAAAVPAAAEERWQVSVSPYLWVPTLTNTLETPFGDVSSSLSRSDVLGDLDFALMGVVDARRGRLTLALDLVYSDLTTERGTPLGTLFDKARVGMKLTALTGYAGWRLHEDDRVSFDVLGGLRHFRLDSTLTLTPGALAGREYDFDDDWTVPVLGARSVVRFDGGWFGTLTADLGSWDGDYTWQGVATVGRRLGENWSVQGGWRYMEFDRSVDGADLQVELNGPLLGATYRF